MLIAAPIDNVRRPCGAGQVCQPLNQFPGGRCMAGQRLQAIENARFANRVGELL
jgi:hypothetical protein